MRFRTTLSLIISAFVALGVFIWYVYPVSKSPMDTNINKDDEISYISLGDSYTIGNGVAVDSRWPNVMTRHLNDAGFKVKLIANPAVSGYRVEDALEKELPVVERLKPDFVTVLIGANDNFGNKDPEIYRQELKVFLDRLTSLLEKPKNIVLITIPDYSKSPAASGYETDGITEIILEYNNIIKEEAQLRGIKVADIFPISQTMTTSQDFISDGLHPSAGGYTKWEEVIYPVVFELLKNQTW